MYQYEVVPLQLSAKEQTSSDVIAQKVSGILNYYSDQGWEYVRIESVPVNVRPGCLGGLLGAKEQVIFLPQIVFRIKK